MSQLFFEEFRLIPAEGVLFRGDEQIPLRPRAFSLLRFMAENPERLLSTSELLDSVWQGVHVGEAVLKVNVRQVRQALGDPARGSRFIETVHRRGYRFLPEVRSHGLPLPLSSLVGRERDLAELAQKLEDRRLLTLTGAGGSGKTRLALEIARRSAARFADGVVFVELAGLSDPALVSHEVARCVGVREQPNRPIAETLSTALERRELLLVLDNCEHLIEACAELTNSLLRRSPALCILVTSREALDISGETVCAVPPLAVPTVSNASLEELARVASIRLLLDRVRSVAPQFDLDDTTAEPLARLCSALDGIPLALELVAARVPTLGVDVLAQRLERDGMMLLSASRSADPRHRTLEATFDWSYRLLAAQEQHLLRNLAVFAGRFTLEAAEAVGAMEGSARGEGRDAVAERISRLVHRSLVEASSASGRMRYRLLEPIRQPAAALLHSSGDADAVRNRHALFYLEQVEQAELEGAEREVWLTRLERERENLRAALVWLSGHQTETASLVRLSSGLLWYWYHLGRWSEARHWLERSVATLAGLEADLRSRALFALGLLEFFTGHYEVAADCLERAAAEAASAHVPRREGLALGFWAMTRLATGDLDGAVSLAERGLVRAKSSTDPWATALALVNLGNALRSRGELIRARSLYQQSAELLQDPRDPWALAMAIRNLGIVDSLEGDLAAAAANFRSSLAELRGGAERWFISRGLEELGAVLSRQGQHIRAARLLGAAEALREVVGAPVVSFYRQGYEDALTELRSALSREVLTAAWEAGRALSLRAALDEASAESGG